MKNLCLLFLTLFPGVLFAQKIITLSVNQPPEFGFSVNKTDTTIERGASVELGTGMTVFGGTGEYNFLWTPSGSLSDSGILNPAATPADTTYYLLTVTDVSGCSFSVGYTVNVQESAVNVSPETQSEGLQAVLYPNPGDGSFKVKLTGNATPKIELIIYTQTGETILKQTLTHFTGEHTETFGLQLAGGIYTLQILTRDEKISRRFVIH